MGCPNDLNHVQNRSDRHEVRVRPCQSTVQTSYSTAISFRKCNILPLRLELTSSTLTRKLTSYLIFEVFGGCPRVSKRIHNSIFRRVRHKPWAQAAMNVLIVTLESGHQSVDRTLAKKSHYMVNHTSTSNPRIRCWGQFG